MKEIEEAIKEIWIDNTSIREKLKEIYWLWFHKGYDEWFWAKSDIDNFKF